MQYCSIRSSHERLLLHKKEPPQSKKQKIETIKDEKKEEECTNHEHHIEETIVGCFEEKDHLHLLKPTYYLCEAKCCKRKKRIVHNTNAKEIDQKNEALLSAKRPMYACENCRGGKNCKFCICYDCLKIIENKAKSGTMDSDGNRRSSRNKNKED